MSGTFDHRACGKLLKEARDERDATRAELAALRELLDEIGTLAANAPEDGDAFGVCEQIAMRIAAVDVPDSTPIAVRGVEALRTRELEPSPGQDDAGTGTALYLSAIARLSAGLREVGHACGRGDAPYAVAPLAAAALADVDRLQLPEPESVRVAARLAATLREIERANGGYDKGSNEHVTWEAATRALGDAGLAL